MIVCFQALAKQDLYPFERNGTPSSSHASAMNSGVKKSSFACHSDMSKA